MTMPRRIFHRLAPASKTQSDAFPAAPEILAYLNKVGIDPQKIFLIYPSYADTNAGREYSLYSLKTPLGVEQQPAVDKKDRPIKSENRSVVDPQITAQELGSRGIATLGLPVDIYWYEEQLFAPRPVAQAVNDLWRALGFGLDPVLAVKRSIKPKSGKDADVVYKRTFKTPEYAGYVPYLHIDGLEPEKHKHLLNFYHGHLEVICGLMKGQFTIFNQEFVRRVCREAYLEGVRARQQPSVWYETTNQKQMPPVVVSQKRAEFHYLETEYDDNDTKINHTPDSYLRKVKELRLEPAETLLVLPSDIERHHGLDIGLYSIKSGAGLAQLSGELGKRGIPTLGLPSKMKTIFKKDDNITHLARTRIMTAAADDKQKIKDARIAFDAMRKLWQAAGYGINIMLPIRDKTRDKIHRDIKEQLEADGVEKEKAVALAHGFYFTYGLCDKQNHEPSWLGYTLKEKNAITNWYMEHLETLKAFLDGNLPEDDVSILPEFVAAYGAGRAARNDKEQGRAISAWYEKKQGAIVSALNEQIPRQMRTVVGVTRHNNSGGMFAGSKSSPSLLGRSFSMKPAVVVDGIARSSNAKLSENQHTRKELQRYLCTTLQVIHKIIIFNTDLLGFCQIRPFDQETKGRIAAFSARCDDNSQQAAELDKEETAIALVLENNGHVEKNKHEELYAKVHQLFNNVRANLRSTIGILTKAKLISMCDWTDVIEFNNRLDEQIRQTFDVNFDLMTVMGFNRGINKELAKLQQKIDCKLPQPIADDYQLDKRNGLSP